MLKQKTYRANDTILNYYEIENSFQPLVLIHAQGVDALSFEKTFRILSKKYHIYSIDCYGHGGSSHDMKKYNIRDIGEVIIEFIEKIVEKEVYLLGHSSGGLIAAYIAAHTNLCEKLILEDPPFFSSQGERRKQTFNYVDLSTVCHSFVNQEECTDFVLYYFENQYAWNLFPDKSREKLKAKLTSMAARYRIKHPEKNLKVMFWPKVALSGFQGMNHYDPMFGETFYNDSFHCGILHEGILKKITCDVIFMKAQTNIDKNGILMAALSEEDLSRVLTLIPSCKIVRYDCGHGIHVERKKEFTKCLLNL